MTEARAQGNNESLANAAIVFITQKGLDAFRLVIEQLLRFYKTSVRVSVETIQYALDSTHKAAQEEWTEAEGMIQSESERIIQETPEYVPAGSTSTTLTLKRTSAPEGHERAVDHFGFETKLPA